MIVALVTGCLAVTGSPGGVAGATSTRTAVVTHVEAEWLSPGKERGRFDWYMIWVRRENGPGGDAVRARLLRGSCRTSIDHGVVSRRCVSNRSIVTDAVTLELTASGDARAAIRAAGESHVVKWDARDGAVPDGAYQEQDDCSAGAGAGAGVIRTTEASGHVFNQRVRFDSPEDSSFVATGAIASECSRP